MIGGMKIRLFAGPFAALAVTLLSCPHAALATGDAAVPDPARLSDPAARALAELTAAGEQVWQIGEIVARPGGAAPTVVV